MCKEHKILMHFFSRGGSQSIVQPPIFPKVLSMSLLLTFWSRELQSHSTNFCVQFLFETTTRGQPFSMMDFIISPLS